MDEFLDAVDKPVFGLVLAGGMSLRMGRDKASLRHPDGRSLARRTADLLTAAGCEKVYLSLRPDQVPPSDFVDFPQPHIIRDQDSASIGPMGGVLAAMNHDDSADWLVASCDLPQLTVETLNLLTQARTLSADFVAFRGEPNELPEPLCAIYPGEKKSIIRQAYQIGNYGLRRLLIHHRCVILDPPTGALTNANTPEDWSAFTSENRSST
ncbi:molybdenum cofactor guanylyltransferase [Luteolibacter pohnpeiensis]|uniref:Molybdenum cofactor guanylyltransferase n=1 Tax=Luteolibacter pohnpeiensis TaxID=454153 RepID=A0A934S4Z0_9BACT|nr:molybdenum cofactor guanylyltransferase [Luteolibacter pohnpeiensis]MBK1882641.1 molybdenum cofactor guanylyltransferase [Luteolibacter pohnpeiensis]